MSPHDGQPAPSRTDVVDRRTPFRLRHALLTGIALGLQTACPGDLGSPASTSTTASSHATAIDPAATIGTTATGPSSTSVGTSAWSGSFSTGSNASTSSTAGLTTGTLSETATNSGTETADNGSTTGWTSTSETAGEGTSGSDGDDCGSTTCSNGGSCVDANCVCVDNFDPATDCRECVAGRIERQGSCVVDLCRANPCNTGGEGHGLSCVVNELGDFPICECHGDFTPESGCELCPSGQIPGEGHDCVDLADHPCEHVQCGQAATCHATSGTCRCDDPGAHMGDEGNCINPCDADPCHVTDGGHGRDCSALNSMNYECSCFDHFDPAANCETCPASRVERQRKCVIDLCLDDPCHTKSGHGKSCQVNARGDDYLCECLGDYVPASDCERCPTGQVPGSGHACVDVQTDPCQGVVCKLGASCQSSDGQCTCDDPDAFMNAEGFCINPCVRNPCHVNTGHGSSCQATSIEDYECRCLGDYTPASDCEQCPANEVPTSGHLCGPGCDGVTCGERASCAPDTGTCHCDDPADLMTSNGDCVVADYFVDADSGHDDNTGTSADPFRTITKGLSVLAAGERLWVSPGTYDTAHGETFPLVVPADASLVAGATTSRSGGNSAAIEGAGTHDSYEVAVVLLDRARLRGFEISVPVQQRHYGALCAGVDVEISDSIFGAGYGGVVNVGENPRVRHNRFETDSYGVSFCPADGYIEHNDFGHVNVPIRTHWGRCRIAHNQITGSGLTGINLTSGDHLIEDNDFLRSEGYSACAITAWADSRSKLRDNRFHATSQCIIKTQSNAAPDLGGPEDSGGNVFGMGGRPLAILHHSTENISADGNHWVVSEPVCGMDIVIQRKNPQDDKPGAILVDTMACFPPPSPLEVGIP